MSRNTFLVLQHHAAELPHKGHRICEGLPGTVVVSESLRRAGKSVTSNQIVAAVTNLHFYQFFFKKKV